jgi:molecular chaperone DnaK (HSP70)
MASYQSADNIEERLRRLGIYGSAPDDELRPKFVIAIDFGTTYSGVAYAYTDPGSGPISSWTINEIRDRIYPVRDWPNRDPMYPDKARTALAYDKGVVVAWGGSVKSEHTTQVTHFKLGLQESVAQYYAGLSVLGGYLSDPNWRHPNLPTKSALDFTADYLEVIRRYVLETSLKKHYSAEFLAQQPLRYVITVPAIWSEKAKALTKAAAERAGIAEDSLDLVTEPEAAAFYCSTLCKEVGLEDGDRFLICDAGGGTVVRIFNLRPDDLGPYIIPNRFSRTFPRQ